MRLHGNFQELGRPLGMTAQTRHPSRAPHRNTIKRPAFINQGSKTEKKIKQNQGVARRHLGL